MFAGRCLQAFDAARNGPKACVYHPQSFSGETRQRWAAPGDAAGGGDVLTFYGCCGADDAKAPGCAAGRHYTFDEDLPVTYVDSYDE